MSNASKVHPALNRNEKAFEIYKLLLPEVQKKSLLEKQRTYEDVARDAVYATDALIEALTE